jgi:hypothetical protein
MIDMNAMRQQPSAAGGNGLPRDGRRPRLTIGVLTRADATTAADLHKRNFPDDLFTLAGERVLVRLFQEFADEISLAAKLDGQLVGYTVGTLDKSRFMRRMVRHHMLILAAGVAPAIIRHAYEAPGYIQGFIRWIATTRPRTRNVMAVAMYDAISREARRLGIPPLFFLELHARWMIYAEQLGAQRIEGQVTDPRMLAALSRLGYRLDRTVNTRTGSKYYVSCRLPAEGAYRWAAQGTYGDPLKKLAGEAASGPTGQTPT